MTWDVTNYSATPGSNSVVNGTNVAEGCNASGINDAIRQIMADIAGFVSGAVTVPQIIASSFISRSVASGFLTGQTVTLVGATSEPYAAFLVINSGVFANVGENAVWLASRVGTGFTVSPVAGTTGNYSVALDGSNQVTVTNISGGNRTMRLYELRVA